MDDIGFASCLERPTWSISLVGAFSPQDYLDSKGLRIGLYS